MKIARGSAGAAAIDGKIHVVGGRGLDGVTVSAHEVYDPNVSHGAKPRRCQRRAITWCSWPSMEKSMLLAIVQKPIGTCRTATCTIQRQTNEHPLRRYRRHAAGLLAHITTG